MKVYVLICDYVYNDDGGVDVDVFDSLEQAMNELAYRNNKFVLDENDMNWTCEYIGETVCMYQEPGNYTGNHIEWAIYEREVITENEK